MIGPFIPGSRGTVMMDVVALALLLVLPLLTYSLVVIKIRRNVRLHSRIQRLLGVLLLVTVVLFELDVRVNGWTTQAKLSPYYDPWVVPALALHLVFAVGAAGLWIYTLSFALKRPPRLGGTDLASRRHRRYGRLTAWFTYATAATGWGFYWLAFIA